LLPKGLNLEELKSNWDDSGLLIIEAPLPKLVESPKTKKEIKIEHLTSGATKSIDDQNLKLKTPDTSKPDVQV
jgi:hypothetical protein